MEFHVGGPEVRGGLTVFPVFNGEAVTARGYDLVGSSITVEERAGAPVVGELVVTNRGARPALVLEGELLEGGWQHRVAAATVLVAPGASAVIEVRCVEQGRWSGGGQHVRGGARAPVAIRAAGGQQQVWDRVARYGASPTQSLLDTTRDRVDAVDDLVGGLRPCAFQSGVLVGVAGQPLLLEVFDSPRILAAVWEGLLRGVAVDAVGAPPVETPGRRARRFVRHLPDTSLDPVDGGCGIGFRGESSYTRVTALHWRGRAVATVAVNLRHPLVSA
ncbi:MAG: hypothetical protein QOF00_2824 [Pseudonocardiales bacterium]|jgi:hypothetical protein|nr:hypothetical protein [Pseudonocardiales bacterium]